MGLFDELLKGPGPDEKTEWEEETTLDHSSPSKLREKTLRKVYEVWYKTKVSLNGGYVSNVVIAGGAIRDLFFDQKPRDIDIYLIPSNIWWKERSKDEEFVVDVLTKVRRKLDSTFGLISHFNAKPLYMRKFIQCKKPCSVLKLGEASYKGVHRYLQFMVPKSRTPQEIVSNFDLDICQFAYDGKEFYTGEEVDLRSVQNALDGDGPVKLVNPITTKSRLDKFKRRYGCDVGPAKKQMERFLKANTSWDEDTTGYSTVANPLHDFYGVGGS